MIEWYGVRQLIDLPGMPSTPQGISKAARKNNWQSRPRAGKGGGKEYHISALPPETQQALRAKAKPTLSVVDNTGKTPPTFTQRDENGLTPDEVALLLKQRDENGLTPDEVALLLKYRALDDQLKTQSQSILDIFSQQKINQSNDE